MMKILDIQLIQNISFFFYEKKSGKNMGNIHDLIKRRKDTNLVFQKCENKSSSFSVDKWILFLGKNSKCYNVCKKTYKICTTPCDHRKLLWQIKVETSCSGQVAVLKLRWVANKFSNIYILICEKLATNGLHVKRHRETPMENLEVELTQPISPKAF